MLPELIVGAFIAWLIVAPDRATLAVTRGAAGAMKGYRQAKRGAAASSSTSSATSSKPSKQGKEKQGAPDAGGTSKDAATDGTSPWRGALAGWHEGVRTARERRDEGRDLWSRGSRMAGRAWGGGESVAAGVRRIPAVAAWLDRRAEKRAGVIDAEIVDEPTEKPTEHSSSSADDMDVVDAEVITDTADEQSEPAPVDLDQWRQQRDNGPDAPQNTPETTTNTTDNTDNSTTTTSTNTTKETFMSMQTTELENIDAVAAEAASGKQMFLAMIENNAEGLKWATNLADRWTGTPWGTGAINAAVTEVTDAAGAGDPEGVVNGLTHLESAVAAARSLGELAAEHDAQGDMSAYRAS